MGVFTPTLKVEPKLGGGGRPPIEREGFGWGEGRGDEVPDFNARLRRYRMGLAIGLAAVIMLFVAFTSAYIVRQGLGSWDPATEQYVRDWKPLQLSMALLMVNTCLLLLSSFTIEKARRAALERATVAPIVAMPGIASGNERPVPWLGITLVLGFAFLAGQLMAWQELGRRGFYVATGPSSSFFYVLTGMHALHLAGGLMALLYAAAAGWFRSRPLERKRIATDVGAWYWHFMGLLWLYIFALLKFAA